METDISESNCQGKTPDKSEDELNTAASLGLPPKHNTTSTLRGNDPRISDGDLKRRNRSESGASSSAGGGTGTAPVKPRSDSISSYENKSVTFAAVPTVDIPFDEDNHSDAHSVITNTSSIASPPRSSRRLLSAIRSHSSKAVAEVEKHMNKVAKVSTFESEAEKAIMKAFEKQELLLSQGTDVEDNIFTTSGDKHATNHTPAQQDRSSFSSFSNMTKSLRFMDPGFEVDEKNNNDEMDDDQTQDRVGNQENNLDPESLNETDHKDNVTNVGKSKLDLDVNDDVDIDGNNKKKSGYNAFPSNKLPSFDNEMIVKTCGSCCSVFFTFLALQWKFARKKVALIVLYIILPSLAIAAILYYACGNPKVYSRENAASASYLFLFFGCRQVLTFLLAKATEILIIDFIALKTLLFVKLFGPVITLLIVQSRGIPILLTFWAIYDLILLYGNAAYVKHWLSYSQLELFNKSNPSGNMTSDPLYLKILIATLITGIATFFKRIYVHHRLGSKSYLMYKKTLQKLIRRILIVSDVAKLSLVDNSLKMTDMYGIHLHGDGHFEMAFKGFDDIDKNDRGNDEDISYVDNNDDISSVDASSVKKRDENSNIDDGNSEVTPIEPTGNKDNNGHNWDEYKSLISKTATKGSDNPISKKEKMTKILGDWVEPPNSRLEKENNKTSILNVLHYQEILNYINDKYPFTSAFGKANSRTDCIKSAGNVFDRLMQTSDSKLLRFETLALIAQDSKGRIDSTKIKYLSKVFRPDRRGQLTKLDFLKSCDAVYKDLRIFRASTTNRARLDTSVAMLFDVVFWTVMLIVDIAILGYFWRVFTIITTVILPFSVFFGAASSKFLQGLLLILVQKPYDVGDRVALGDPAVDSPAGNSTTWYVEGITMYKTTLRNAATNEVATHSNGSLALLRIINAARSPNGNAKVEVRFGIDVPQLEEKIAIFKDTVKDFIEQRPREWVRLNSIKCGNIEVKEGYVSYGISAQHVESWQNIGAILQSKADLTSFCLEVSKALKMDYISPAMPVTLTFDRSGENANNTAGNKKDKDGDGEKGSEPASLNLLEIVSNLFTSKM